MGRGLVRVREAARVFAAVFRSSNLRRVEIAFAAFGMAEYGTWVAILVFAFQRGGAGEAGLVAVIQLVPATILAPFASAIGDRMRRDRALLLSYVAQTATMGGTAAALLLDAPIPVTYAMAAAAAASVGLTRPIQSALLPDLSRTPEELTAANAAAGTIESAAILAGPALAGLLLGVSGAGTVYAVFAAGLLVGAVLVAGVSSREQAADLGESRPLREAVEGIRSVAGDPAQRVVVGLVGAKSVVVGAIDVLVVVIALSLLGLHESAAGYLTAAVGAGGIVGGAVALGLVGRTRLAPSVGIGLMILGLAVAAVGLSHRVLVVTALLLLAGVGHTLADVAGRTLLQRVVPDQVLSRVFGVMEGLHMAALAVGSALAPALIALFGLRGGIAASGLILPAAVVLLWRPLRAADLSAPVPGPELDLLRAIPMFAPLPAPSLEDVASRLVPVDASAGTAIITQGRPGDRFYVVADGEVDVSRDGESVARLGAGDHFGEVALLHDAPRNATVTALGPVRLLALERADFLEAVTGHPISRAAADRVARSRKGGES